MEVLPLFNHIWVTKGLLYPWYQILEQSQRRKLSYLRPQLGCLKSAVRSRSFESVRNKNGCIMSSIGKVDLSFGFNDTI